MSDLQEYQNRGGKKSTTNEPVKHDIQSSANQEIEVPVNEEVTKQSFRKKVWDYLEKNRISSFPRPVYGRIPNFKGSKEAAARLLDLEEFKAAKSVEVNPDKPLEAARILVLENDKELYVPVPRLKENLLKKLSKDGKNSIASIVSRWGLEHTGKPVNMDDQIHIDFFVLGSVAVSKEGYRIGKGKGYADLEFAILKDMNAIDDNTIIATTVHDCQVFDELPKELFQKYDVPVDYILTHTKIIKVENRLKRPEGIFWNLLSNRRVNEMQVLQKLREKHQREGKDTTLKEVDSDVENGELRRGRKRPNKRYFRRPRTVSRTSEDQENTSPEMGKPDRFRRRSRYFRRSASMKKEKQISNGEVTDNKEKPERERPKRNFRRHPFDFSLIVSNIERNVRVRDLKNALIENGIRPDSITWRGYRGFCYLHYAKPNSSRRRKVEDAQPYAVDNVIEVLQKMKISPDSTCSLEVKVMDHVSRIETTDVTAV